MFRNAVPAAIAGCLLLVAAPAALAQQYPSKPVRLVVPFPPGGLIDTVARNIQPRLQEGFRQPVVIENRAGAGGTVGTDVAAKSAPDGYTLLMVFDSHAVNPHIYKKLPFDTFKDFAPISLLARNPLVLVAPPSLPATNVKELVAAAKAKPGSLAYASVGAGSSNHLVAELFKASTGTDLLHVPYKGGGPAITAVLAAEVQVMFLSATISVPHVRSGKMKALAVTGDKRSSALPNVPTLAESGIAGFEIYSWVGLLAPAGMPAPIVQRVQQAFTQAIKSPDVQAKLAEQGLEVVASSPEAFGQHLRVESDKWGKLIRERNISIEQ